MLSPVSMKSTGVFKQTLTEFGEDKVPRLGAALAYYTIFSLAPLLLIAIAVAGMLFGDEAAQKGITDELGKVMGPSTAASVEDLIKSANRPKAGVVAVIVGVVTLFFGATAVFGQLKDALNTIWNVEERRAGGVMGFIRHRFLSMTMVMGVVFLLLVSLTVDAAITGMSAYVNRLFPGAAAVIQILQLIISFGLVTLLFALIFRYLPDIKVAWRDVWFGAAFTSVLFVIGKFGLGLYLGKAAPGSSFGAAGSLVVLLIWVYWSAQILFFGAEFTQVYARTQGSMIGDTSKRDARARAARVEDRATRPAAPPRPAGPRIAARRGGGGKGKLAAGGIAGLLVGTLVGAVTAAIVTFRSFKKLLTLPFR
ncbi:MAG TPA: YihY/virulence factor BrkB family protein [Thermoanaerobaculia bacterium]|nr:YihY/virulence factor BrkB family protein [Thermoanaerobaculia bacterium]